MYEITYVLCLNALFLLFLIIAMNMSFEFRDTLCKVFNTEAYCCDKCVNILKLFELKERHPVTATYRFGESDIFIFQNRFIRVIILYVRFY